MKCIGLLGGMSWESSAYYYRLLNEQVKEQLGGLHSANCLMYSVDFHLIEQMQIEGRWAEAGLYLVECAKKLEHGGARAILLCTNTMHKVFDIIQNEVGVPLIHIADATAENITQKRIRKVGLLGTIFTMEQEFYRGRIEQKGIEVIVPNVDQRKEINRIIYQELCLGIVSSSSRQCYQEAISELKARGAQGVILGCTEIGLLINQEHCDIPIFDTTAIHAQAGVTWLLTDS